MGFIFKNKGQEETPLKKWVVVFFHLILPVALGVWGLLLSIAANRNRDQIEALTKVVTQLKDQNSHLQTLIMLSNNQLQSNLNEIKLNKRPALKAESWGGEIGEVANLFIRITNTGGELSNLSISPLNGSKVDTKTLPKSKSIIPGSEYVISINNIKSGKVARFIYTNVLMNKFSQDLYYDSNSDLFQFGPMNEISN